jgi:hypothetical protein
MTTRAPVSTWQTNKLQGTKETEDKQTICEQLQGTEKLMLP